MHFSFGTKFGEPTAYVYRHAFAQLFFWCSFYYLMPAISAQIATEAKWPMLHISITFTMAFLVWALFAPFVGMAIDRGWGRVLMFAGGVTGTLVLCFLSTVTDRWIFSGSLLVLGACMAATLYDPCFALMMRRLDGRGIDAVAIVTLIAGFATLLTFPLVLALSGVMEWREIVLVFAALSFVAVCLLPKHDRLSLGYKACHDTPPLKIGLAPVLIAFAFGFTMMGHAILLFLLPMVLAQGDDVSKIGIVAVAILGPAQIAGRLAWKAYGGNYTPQISALVLFIGFCVPPVLLIMFGPDTGVVYMALIVQGACYGVHTILRPLLARLSLPIGHLGSGLGSIATVGLVMMALGPALGGFIWSSAGFIGLMSCVLMLNLFALCLIFILSRLRLDKGMS